MSWTIISKGCSRLLTKKARSCECKESGLVLKNIYYLFNHTPGAKECLITRNDDELVCPVNTDALEKYFVKMKRFDKSQTWKGGLGKKERLGGLKTWKGGSGKI